MKIEKFDESICASDINPVEGYCWNVLKRDDGSISVYATVDGEANHRVVFDSLDSEPPSVYATNVIKLIIGKLLEDLLEKNKGGEK